ncbi:MAG: hypothetical protein V1816_21060 [Pseudomonadota bacterium]
MNRAGKKWSRQWSFLVLVLVISLSWGCGGTGSSGGGTGSPLSTITGVITGVDAQGGLVELLDENGQVLASSRDAVDAQGWYRLPIFTQIPSSDYHVLRLVKDESILRAALIGYTGQVAYTGLDASISPESEAAFILCGLTEEFNFSEYAAFLRAMVDGVFNPDDVEEAGVYFHEIIDDLTVIIAQAFDSGKPRTDLFAVIGNLIEEQSHKLDDRLPAGSTEGMLIHNVFVDQERSGLVFAAYNPLDSTINPDDPVGLTSSDEEDGSFIWKEYALDLGLNIISYMNVSTGRINASTQASDVFGLNPRPGALSLEYKLASRDAATRLGDSSLLFENIGGVVHLAASNVSAILDIDGSGLSPLENNTSAAFKVAFKNEVHAGDISIRFLLEDDSGTQTPLQTVVVTRGNTFVSGQINLIAAANQDKLIIAKVVSKRATLYAISDVIDKIRYQGTFPMIAAKSMSETRSAPNGTDFYNNLHDTNDDGLLPQATGNAYSHYIVDLDRLLGQGVVPAWDGTPYGQAPLRDMGRLPLILVHGWQGDKNNRSAARLSFWKYSPVSYFYKFIAYYLATPELNQKYHLYLMRWPSYKHLTFNADMLARMLQGIEFGDIGAAMTDASKGVSFITHSTGGLIVRTAIETHGALSDGSDPGAYLRGAILLASPNHGTQLATNMLPNNLLYDVSTQSSSDLQWDSFDGQTWVLANPYWLDRITSRWPLGVENAKSFDQFYQNQLENPNTTTFNPWLLSFNQVFAKGAPPLRDKYILYSGWTRVWPSSANFLDNWITMDAAGIFLKLVGGLQNDSVLPNCSTLLASSKHDQGFYLASSDLPTQAYYPNSGMYFLDGAPIITMGGGAGSSAQHQVQVIHGLQPYPAIRGRVQRRLGRQTHRRAGSPADAGRDGLVERSRPPGLYSDRADHQNRAGPGPGHGVYESAQVRAPVLDRDQGLGGPGPLNRNKYLIPERVKRPSTRSRRCGGVLSAAGCQAWARKCGGFLSNGRFPGFFSRIRLTNGRVLL